MGVNEEVADFGIPFGVTFNMDSMVITRGSLIRRPHNKQMKAIDELIDKYIQ